MYRYSQWCSKILNKVEYVKCPDIERIQLQVHVLKHGGRARLAEIDISLHRDGEFHLMIWIPNDIG